MANVTFKNNPVTLLGEEVKVGDTAPDFTVLANDLSPVTLADTNGKIRLISVIPSIDTGVCSKQTRTFNEEATSLGEDVHVLTISVDLPLRKPDGARRKGLKTSKRYLITEISPSGKLTGSSWKNCDYWHVPSLSSTKTIR